jgi:hypothetical protein
VKMCSSEIKQHYDSPFDVFRDGLPPALRRPQVSAALLGISIGLGGIMFDVQPTKAAAPPVQAFSRIEKAFHSQAAELGILPAQKTSRERFSFPLFAKAQDVLTVDQSRQSPGWEAARQKRTAAIKLMEEKKMLKVTTDDRGNQFLSLPWIPNSKFRYKSLSLQQRLANECFAGAAGEFSKDILLYGVDTAKTRRQVRKKQVENVPDSGANESYEAYSLEQVDINNEITDSSDQADSKVSVVPLMGKINDLYTGFPVVLSTSIPQGALFFLVKGIALDFLSRAAPELDVSLASIIPIFIACAAYWVVRTPAEVIKTNVQAGLQPDVKTALRFAKGSPEGFQGLWKFYRVMLSLDIPMQVINFILYGIMFDAVQKVGIEQGVLSRLGVGIACGMVAAAVTCPLDVCKTRIQTARIAENVGSQSRGSVLAPEGGEGMESRTVNLSDSSENGLMGSEAQPLVTHDTSSDQLADEDAGYTGNMYTELITILQTEGIGSLFLGLQQRVLYTGLANGIRFAAYGTSRMDLMMRSLDEM